MSRLRRTEFIESYYPSFFLRETSIFTPKTLPFPSVFDQDLEEYEFDFALGLVKPNPRPSPSPIELLDSVTDLIHTDQNPSFSSYKRIQRVERLGVDVVLQSLCDRVSKLESRYDRILKASGSGDRKYSCTAEIKGPGNHGIDRKYKWIAEVKEGKKEATGKTYKWTVEFEGKGLEGPIKKTYTFKASAADEGEFNESKKKEKKKKSKKEGNETRIVEIESGGGDHRAVVLRQAFAKRAGARGSAKGKKKELSPQDAALMIQMSFRAYLIHRSKVLRALRDLAIAKTKLKDIRASFDNFSYRRRLTGDAEERQRFTEKIIVLLLTVDSIEGADLMVRAAKRSIIDELQAMLHVIDPQPPGNHFE